MVRNLKVSLLAMAMVAGGSASAQYQLANSDFEEWESVTYSGKTGNEPVKWSSFLDGTGDLKSMAGYSQLEKSSDKPAGSAGSYSAKLTSRAVKLGSITLAIAQGNLTNGCVNMGGTTATDASKNYNYINTTRKDQSMTFTGRPDAVKVWVRFKGTKTGNVEVDLVGEGTFQSPVNPNVPNEAELIAKAQNASIPSNDTWTEYTIPFTYSSESVPAYSLVNISTCATPGAGKAADYMYVDDMVMVYNSELESATFDGNDIVFEGTSATVNDAYDESKLELTSNGQAATIVTSYDESTSVLTITVKGDNISEDASNYHEYTVQFVQGEPEPGVVDSKTYPETLYVTVDGQTTDPQTANVVVETLDNGNINFTLKNFILGEGEEAMPIGNISIKNLELNADGSFAFNDNLIIENGDDETIFWFGPMLDEIPLELAGKFAGEDKVYVTIDINIGQVVNVHLGYEYATLNVTDAGYATFFAPFAVKAPDGIKAYTCSSVNENSELVLEEIVLTENIPANVPVILAGSEGSDQYFGVAEPSNGSSCGLLTGVYEETAAPVGSYVLQQQGEKVAFFKVEDQGIMVPANRAYLSAPLNAKVLGFTTAATAINAVNALVSGKAEVYGANGARQNGLQKGMNIVKMADGSVQKVLVK